MCVYDGEGTKYNIIITFLNFAYACLTARFDIRFLHTHTHTNILWLKIIKGIKVRFYRFYARSLYLLLSYLSLLCRFLPCIIIKKFALCYCKTKGSKKKKIKNIVMCGRSFMRIILKWLWFCFLYTGNTKDFCCRNVRRVKGDLLI